MCITIDPNCYHPYCTYTTRPLRTTPCLLTQYVPARRYAVSSNRRVQREGRALPEPFRKPKFKYTGNPKRRQYQIPLCANHRWRCGQFIKQHKQCTVACPAHGMTADEALQMTSFTLGVDMLKQKRVVGEHWFFGAPVNPRWGALVAWREDYFWYLKMDHVIRSVEGSFRSEQQFVEEEDVFIKQEETE